MAPGARQAAVRMGRYRVLGRIAAGGMGTVHLARQLGDAGFARTVAIKFLHPHLATLSEFVERFLEEARLAARIRHANVVATIDVVEEDDTLCLVMEYVRGESVAALVRLAAAESERVPPPVAVRIVADMLRGLHAAHSATDDDGAPLAVVHRDVSPQNVLVGLDGAAHLLDFGIAKAAGSIQTTAEGQLKGKLRYMAPEQIVNHEATPRTDVYAAAVVLWELLAGRKLFEAANDGALLAKVLEGAVLPPSHFAPGSPELDAVVLRGLERDPQKRSATAEAMALDLERAGGVAPATASEVGAWVERLAGAAIRAREATLTSETDLPLPTTNTATKTATALTMPEPPVETTAPMVHAGLSAHAPTEAVARRGRRRSMIVGLSAFALAAIATIAVAAPRVLRRHDASPTPSAPPPLASDTSPPPPPPVAIASTPSSSAAPSLASASPSAPSGRRPPGASAVKDRGARPDCSTPYYRDASGIRRVKRECL